MSAFCNRNSSFQLCFLLNLVKLSVRIYPTKEWEGFYFSCSQHAAIHSTGILDIYCIEIVIKRELLRKKTKKYWKISERKIEKTHVPSQWHTIKVTIKWSTYILSILSNEEIVKIIFTYGKVHKFLLEIYWVKNTNYADPCQRDISITYKTYTTYVTYNALLLVFLLGLGAAHFFLQYCTSGQSLSSCSSWVSYTIYLWPYL